MDNVMERPFSKMGAAVKVNVGARVTNVNVLGDKFIINLAEGCDAEVVNIDAKDRHLLLMTRDGQTKAKFLCGHDERHWFVAAVPEQAAATTVRDAKAALMPERVREATKSVKRSKRRKRRNEAFVRQGEWFFTPAPEFDPTVLPNVVFEKNAPISRGRGKPHIVQEIARFGGVTEYEIIGKGIISADEWGRMSQDERRRARARTRTRDATVYGRGTVRHPDHATINLIGWHRIEMNTESRAASMQWVAFYD